MSSLVFSPYLFDDRLAWEKTVNDSEWYYDMPFDSFMSIYQRYRTKTNIAHKLDIFVNSFTLPELTKNKNDTNVSSIPMDSLLSQSEIDELLSSFSVQSARNK